MIRQLTSTKYVPDRHAGADDGQRKSIRGSVTRSYVAPLYRFRRLLSSCTGGEGRLLAANIESGSLGSGGTRLPDWLGSPSRARCVYGLRDNTPDTHAPTAADGLH